MTATDTARRLEMEQETIRIKGKEFKKWQRESANEQMKAQNIELETKHNLEKEREKASIWYKADHLQRRHQQQQQIQQQQMKELQLHKLQIK